MNSLHLGFAGDSEKGKSARWVSPLFGFAVGLIKTIFQLIVKRICLETLSLSHSSSGEERLESSAFEGEPTSTIGRQLPRIRADRHRRGRAFRRQLERTLPE